MEQKPVLIVGAGPVGLFCANELTRHGVPCRIIDKKEGISTQSKALALHIRTLECFKACGLISDVLEQGQKIRGMMLKTQYQPIASMTFEGLESHWDYLINLPQNKTESILLNHLKAKSIHVDWQTELVGVSTHADGVTAEIKHKSGDIENNTYAWLIACDGSHSFVRHHFNLSFNGAEYHQNWWLADCYIHWDEPQDMLQMYPDESGMVACFPMGDSRYRLVMTALEGYDGSPDFEDIKNAFEQRVSKKAKLSNPVWVTKFYIHHRQIEQYKLGRVFFAGDAAHIHSPAGGQGLNTGIQDVYNLAWKLALVYKRQLPEKLLDSYHAERFPVGQHVLQTTDRMTRMILIKNPMLIKARNLFMKWILSFQFVQKKMTRSLSELDITYQQSEIVKDLGHNKRIKAGSFLTGLELVHPNSLETIAFSDALSGIKHHLFLFTGISGHPEKALYNWAISLQKQYGQVMDVHLVLNEPNGFDTGDIHLWETNKSVQELFRLERPLVVLVRPDQYVGLSQSPIVKSQLEKALQDLFKAG